jgi:hypothetical protein
MNAPNTTTLLAAYLTTRTEHAYNALVRGFRSMLVATAHAVLRDQAAAEDVVQELLFAVRSMTVADLDTAAAVQGALGAGVDLILDGGPTPGGLPSTMVDARDRPHLLRAGALPTDLIRAALARQGYELSS